MRQPRAWRAHLAVVGLSLTWFGCGGGNAPEPVSNSSAAPDASQTEVASAAEETASAAPAVPSVAKQPAAPKGDASGTTELLNLANAAPPPAEEAKGDAPASEGAPGSSNAAYPSAPPSSGMPAGYPGSGGSSGSAYPNAPPGSGMPAGYPGAGGSSGSAYPNAPPSSGMPSGYPGAGGSSPPPSGPGAGYPTGPGGASGMPGMDDKGPPNFNHPVSATTAFLKAVKAKDRDKLAEATALRAPQEATSERMRKLFATVVDQSVSDEALTELAKILDGFTIVDMNLPKSTGRYGIILAKPMPNGAGQYRRTLTVRKEAKGWKVVDIGAQGEMETFRGMGGKSSGRRR